MNMDHEQDSKHSRRDRWKGKIFGASSIGRDRKLTNEESANEITNFLGGADRLAVTHPIPPPPPHTAAHHPPVAPPTLALDTSKATRYPDATSVDSPRGHRSQASLTTYRARSGSHSPNPPSRSSKKGLTVRFSDNYPEIIGEGGDECEAMVNEIGKRKRAKSIPAPIPPTKQGHEYARQIGAAQDVRLDDGGFVPGPIRRTQTGFSSVGDSPSDGPSPPPPRIRAEPPEPPQPRVLPAGHPGQSRFLDVNPKKDENRRSFIEMQQHEQRMAEGKAFAEAQRAASVNSNHDWDETSPPRDASREPPARLRKAPAPPPSSYRREGPPSRAFSHRAPPPVPAQSSGRLMRAQSSRTFSPPMRSPPQQQAPADSSYLPSPPSQASSRSPLQVSDIQNTPSPFDDPPDTVEQVTVNVDNLKISTEVPDSPTSADSGSVYSTEDRSPPGNPPSRAFAPSSPDAPRVKPQSPQVARMAPPSPEATRMEPRSPQNTRMAPPSPEATRLEPPSPEATRPVLPSPERSGRGFADVVSAAGDEALDIYVARTTHLYELFRLYSEQIQPLDTARADDLCRAALWWFLKGRTALENVIRNKPANPDDMKYLMAKYQAYTDLTKGYWLTEKALPEVADGKYSPVDGELGEIRQVLVANLRKLAVSMKRNDFLPPEEPFLPQTMDKSIWVEYPSLSQDMVALLNGISGSTATAAQQPIRSMDLLEALPIGDSGQNFNYGRVNADAYLMEQGAKSGQTHLPCILTMLRPANDSNIVFVLASQNNTVTLKISSDKKAAISWQDVKWKPDTCSLEIKLPRGFVLAVQCTQQDFRTLWGMYDFSNKIQSYLYPRQDEVAVYTTKLRAFHYFDANPQGRKFPKDRVGECELTLFERVLKEASPHGPRTFHRGFRVAVVTGPSIRTLSGVTHFYTPQRVIQFAYMRENSAPVLQLYFSDGKDKGRMLMTFGSDSEREKLLRLLNGTHMHHDEEAVVELQLEGMQMSEGLSDTRGGFPAIQRLPWQRARIINDRYAGDSPPVVLAEKLRVEVESINKGGVGVLGTVTDRINVAPGELRLRLGTKNIMTLQVLRHPQLDMTTSVSENLAPREAMKDFALLQSVLPRTPTVRTYRFMSFKDLHAFQAGLTGYKVLYDGIAQTLNISRRRMVVPIHKKWDAGTTRIQVVQQEGTVQLLAFFEDWHHGQCMGFILKGTDVFECLSRNGKMGLKLVDARFPLPKVPAEGESATDDMAFVCLDMPDFAGENDDLTILFDDPNERDRLCSVLPAPVKGSRLSKGK